MEVTSQNIADEISASISGTSFEDKNFLVGSWLTETDDPQCISVDNAGDVNTAECPAGRADGVICGRAISCKC